MTVNVAYTHFTLHFACRSRIMSTDIPIAEMQIPVTRVFDVVLEPLTHPELGEIRIERELFAIGRAETPFATARADIVADLSRRHAKIFFEQGAAYVADLHSKNGTTVDGEDVRAMPRRLRDGDELRLAGVLAFRVRIESRARQASANETATIAVTLKPERDDLGLETIVVTSFPFLVSKTDQTFARYRDAFPHQVNYLSRRHAMFFVADGEVFLEDLGSTNGTFIDGKRLDEGAVAIGDGGRIAFGGNHFVYRVGIARGSAAEPTVTQARMRPEAAAPASLATPAPAPTSSPSQEMTRPPQPAAQTNAPLAADDAKRAAAQIDAADASAPAASPPQPLADVEDRTTFIAAPHSFLDIYCIDAASPDEDEVNPEANSQTVEPVRRTQRREAGRFARFVSELSVALGGSGEVDTRRVSRWASVTLALLVVLAAILYLRGASEREMQSLLASGRFAQASQFADGYLAQHPSDARFRAAGTEAAMKWLVPPWLAALGGHDFARARANVAAMTALTRHNPDISPLARMIGWIGDLDAYWAARGGADAPIRIYRDEPVIKSLIERWDDDVNAHQRELDQIVSYVPAFGDTYADALSHLRQLDSDESVYVAALDRLKTAIEAALNDARDDPLQALSTMLDDYGERYRRLAGLDDVRADLTRYRQIEAEARAGHAQAVADALRSARFATPQFQAHAAGLTKLAAASQGSAP
jgi:pSer/pThr/pTyr-binding forkhead associated (FHA) protein